MPSIKVLAIDRHNLGMMEDYQLIEDSAPCSNLYENRNKILFPMGGSKAPYDM
jgi:hypothetical protein